MMDNLSIGEIVMYGDREVIVEEIITDAADPDDVVAVVRFPGGGVQWVVWEALTALPENRARGCS